MGEHQFNHPEALVTGDWLEAHLEDADLRIFDCTFQLVYEVDTGQPYHVISGRADHDAGHIPGSGHLDLQGEFSVRQSPYHFTLPPVRDVADAFARHGVSDRSRVVLYSRKNVQCATRFWWMLRWLGFDNAAVLDGCYDTWVAEGRPVSTLRCRYPQGELSVNPRPELFVGKDAVLAAVGDAGTCTINALSPALHSGEDPRYGRPGRIPGSVNVPAATLFDRGTLKILPADSAAQSFAAIDAEPEKPIIAYCGGGIAATLDAYVLHQLGYRDIAVYDNSMSEWAKDAQLPMESD
jgi:thiosulfate/3-mercaptopyruvate sulfurtransferase